MIRNNKKEGFWILPFHGFGAPVLPVAHEESPNRQFPKTKTKKIDCAKDTPDGLKKWVTYTETSAGLIIGFIQSDFYYLWPIRPKVRKSEDDKERKIRVLV